jgi:hypothetical protein
MTQTSTLQTPSALVTPWQDKALLSENLVIVQKKYFGLTLQQVRKHGWEYDWSQCFTPQDILTLAQLKQPWHYFKAICPPGLSAALHAQLSDSGLAVYMAPFQTESVVTLTDGWHAYWQSRPHNHKRDIQRHINKLTKTGYSVEVIHHADQLTAMLSLFFDWHQSYWQFKGSQSKYSNAQHRQQLTQALQHSLATDQLWGMVLMINQQPASISFGIQQAGQVYSLLSAYDADFSAYSPGNSLLYLELQHAAEHGIHTFLLGPGDNFQKSRWQTDSYPTHVMLSPNPKSIIGRLVVISKLLTRSFNHSGPHLTDL